MSLTLKDIYELLKLVKQIRGENGYIDLACEVYILFLIRVSCIPFRMVWNEILNAGSTREYDPHHDDEIYGPSITIGGDFITEMRDNYYKFNSMVEIRLQVRVQFWRAVYAVVVLVIDREDEQRIACKNCDISFILAI